MPDADAHRRYLAHFLGHRDGLYAFILVLVRDRTLVEDLFQETSLILWEKFDSFREGTNFGAWARQIAYNLIRNSRRHHARVRGLLSEVAAGAVSEAFTRMDEQAGEEAWRGALKTCLERLTLHARNLVELRYFQDLQLGEIARKLGRTPTGVNSALCKVRASLETCLRRSAGGSLADA